MVAGDVVLKFENSIIPQETYYWCGPATMQVLLRIRGISVTEKYMADQLGTTVNGTDTILYLARELNERVGDLYRIVQVADPPSRAAKDAFFAAVKHSVDAGFGVGANIIAPPSNPPRPTRGEPLRGYGSSTIYHYLSIVGYNETTREIAIADSGFSPYFYWVNADAFLSVIAGKGYTWAANAKSTNEFLGSLTDAQQQKVLAASIQVGEPHRGV